MIGWLTMIAVGLVLITPIIVALKMAELMPIRTQENEKPKLNKGKTKPWKF